MPKTKESKMKNQKKILSLGLAATAILAMIPTALLAAPPSKDVSVVNTPGVVVLNDNPIPVVIDNSGEGGDEFVTVSIRDLVEAPTATITRDVYQVPAGKMLIVEYISIYLDVAVNNRPASGLKIAGNIAGNGTTGYVRFELGYMEEFGRTSRGTPNFVIARNVTAYYSEGAVQCTADSHFAGSDLDFGVIECALSGRLVDAP